METRELKTILNNRHKNIEGNISNYISYLTKFSKEKNTKTGQLKNPWVTQTPNEVLANVFTKVLQAGVFIDGETVTIQKLGGSVIPNFNYQAYRNLVLVRYPETILDVQLVKKDDEYKFWKETGKVFYKHEINNPFSKENDIIGAYCIVKNSRGEFIETLNMDDIAKMRKVAKTQNIWNNWFGEMVKKSVIKRACKTHFRDIVEKVDLLDNDNYDLDQIYLPEEVKGSIDQAETVEELQKIYNASKKAVDSEENLLAYLNRRKEEILQTINS